MDDFEYEVVFDLALKQKQKDNRLGKVFNVVGWENIIKEFNANTVMQYEFL